MTSSATDDLRLARIAEVHHKDVDDHGGTMGYCNECGWVWPCPTYRWATEDGIDINCTWDLSECSFPEHQGHAQDVEALRD